MRRRQGPKQHAVLRGVPCTLGLGGARSGNSSFTAHRHALRKRLKGRRSKACSGRSSGGVLSPGASARSIRQTMVLPVEAPVLSPALIASLSRGEVRLQALQLLATPLGRVRQMCK